MRADEDQHEFATWLLALGNGDLQSEHQTPVAESIPIPPRCNISEGDIIDDVFPDLSNPKELAQTVILTPTNDASLKLNEQVLKKVPGQEKIYLSADTAICDDQHEANNYTPEFLNSLTPSGMPPHKLHLKIGAIIMLLRNLNIRRGLCNGTRLIVHRLHDRVLDAEILTGTHKGERVLIPRIKLAPSDASLPFILQRIQFPLRLSYSMTINKSQGQTFDKLGIFLSAPVFSHGQLYVAFSRARSFKDIHVKIAQSTTQGRFNGEYITPNVVFKEIL
jgi:ATP-dependent exoDNAse (exonuclease V) alpha subunit